MADSNYQQIYAGEWFPVPRREYRQACCDCGLVHVIDFRLRKRAIELRVRVDKRATGQYRRQERARQAAL